MFKFASQCSPKQAQFCLQNRKFLEIPTDIGLEGEVALLTVTLGFYWVALIKSAWYKFSIFSRALVGVFCHNPYFCVQFRCSLSGNDNWSPSHFGEKSFNENLPYGFHFFYRLRFCLKQFMFPKLRVRCKTSGTSCSSWALTGDSTMHQNACPLFLTESAGHREAFCVLCYGYKWAPATTEHSGFVFSVWTVFLILRSRVVAGEQLLCNNLSGFPCVSPWIWCLNSFPFVRLHWFCASPKSWLCTGLTRSWASGYDTALELHILFTVYFSYFASFQKVLRILK